jgi:hypothetical protein
METSMKSTLKYLSLAFVLALTSNAHAQSFTAKTYRDRGGNREVIDNGGTLKFKNGSIADSSEMVFNSTLTGNPLVQGFFMTVPVASANTGQNLFASVSGRTIYPTGALTIMASGTASGATAVTLKCVGSGTTVAKFLIASLVSNVPVGPFASAGNLAGPALTQGCPVSDTIMVSVTGSNLATTTHLYINMPYILQ